MLTRRTFLQTTAVAAAYPQPQPKRIAIVATIYRYLSHAQHMGDRFLVGYPHAGAWHKPNMKVVSLYVDQKPEGDLSEARAKEFGFQVYPTIAETLRCGGNELAVDARPDHRRARQLPEQREGTDPLSALRVLRAVRRGLREGRPRRPGLQRQAPLLQLRESQSGWWTLRSA